MEQYKIRRRAVSESESAGGINQEVLQESTKSKASESQTAYNNKVRELYPQEKGLQNHKANSQGSSNNLVHLLLFLILLSNIALFARQGSVSEGQNSTLSELSENMLQLKELSEKYLPELSKLQSSVSEIQEKIISFVDDKASFNTSSSENKILDPKRKNLIRENTLSKPFKAKSLKTSGNVNSLDKSSSSPKDSTNTFPDKDKQELKSSRFQDDKLNPPSIFDPQEENSSSESNSPSYNSSQSSLHKTHLNKSDASLGTVSVASAPIQCWQAKTKHCYLKK